MVFKLVRTDIEEPCKIQLPLGTHIIGRGKFLDCDDKKVSRNHGELQITEDSITIKALHQNPCFFIKKGTPETQIVKQGSMSDLGHGDKFGLLPDSYWYEVLHCTMLDFGIKSPQVHHQENNKDVSNREAETRDTTDEDVTQNDSQQLLIFDMNETVEEMPESPSLIPTQRIESPSLTQPKSPLTRSETPVLGNESQSLNSTETQNSETQDYQVNQEAEPKTPSKRSHSPDNSADEAKKVKTEPVDVKQEPADAKPGPSNNQGDPSKADNQQPSSNGPGRERCMYGANCYRKNPQHKVEFSHPSDADWGTGARGVCPWGRGCRRQDSRHWRDHEHPPGMVQPPPAPRPAPNRKKNRQNSSDEDSDVAPGLIVTGKRKRKTVQRHTWSGSESENEDPYQTDESDEWVPGSEVEHTQSQDLLD